MGSDGVILHHTTDPLTATICETAFENLATYFSEIHKLNSKFVDVAHFIPVTRYKNRAISVSGMRSI
jgi:hypothetical protein